MNPIAITSGGPSPNHDSPDSEFSGFERSMIDLTRMYGHHDRPDQRDDADEHEVPHALRQLVPEVDDAREPGHAVVEEDEDPDREDRVVERVLAHERQADVPDDRQNGHPDRRDARGHVLRVDAREPLRERALDGHRQRRSRRRQDRRLRRRRGRRQHRDDQQLVERRAEDVPPEGRQHVELVVLEELRARGRRWPRSPRRRRCRRG